MIQRFFKTCLLLLFTSVSFLSKAQDKFEPYGFIDPNIYYDSRNFSTLTINSLYQINEQWQYFGFFNNDGVLNDKSTEVNSFYSEHNIRYQIKKSSPIALTNQNVLVSGNDNDSYRLGVMINLNQLKKLASFFNNQNLIFSINIHAIQWNIANSWTGLPQLEYVFRKSFFKNKLYWFAFCDQNILFQNNKTTFKWVTEHQLGVKLTEHLYAVVELRLNTYIKEFGQTGVGFGLEYMMKF